jgi:hypothetical protein
MNIRISKDELQNLTADQWNDWFHAQAVELRGAILLAVETLETRGFNLRQAMVGVYAVVESAKLDELDRIMNLPHSVN